MLGKSRSVSQAFSFSTLVWAKALDGADVLAPSQRDYKRARACFEQGLELFRKQGNYTCAITLQTPLAPRGRRGAP